MISMTRRAKAKKTRLLPIRFQETGYPDAESHAAEHAILTRKVMDIHEKLKSGSVTALTHEVLPFLVSWIMDHTMGSDKKYSAHLIAAGVR